DGVERLAAHFRPTVILFNTDYMVSQVLPVASELRVTLPRLRDRHRLRSGQARHAATAAPQSGVELRGQGDAGTGTRRGGVSVRLYSRVAGVRSASQFKMSPRT